MSKYVSHFKAREFACKCCHKGGIKDSTREKVEAARNIAGIPFIVTSGYRCKLKQAKLVARGVSSLTSSHPKGYAIDIYAPTSNKRWVIVDALKKAGFKRIGIGRNFIHADDDPDKPVCLMWVYND